MNNKFVDKMKNYLDKGVKASKDTLDKAGDAVQKLGDKSITKVEQMQMEQKLKQEYLELGKICYGLINEKETVSISSSDTGFQKHFSAIKDIKAKLDQNSKPEDGKSE